MVIEEKDFKMTNSEGGLWDLELLYIVRPKGKPSREEFKVEGYGMTMVNCLKRVINYRLDKKQDVYTLKEYLRDYKKELDEIKELFKEI